MMRRIFFIALLFMSMTKIVAQDIHFSQFYLAPLVQNPAMAGTINNFEGNVNHRKQWAALGAPFVTTAASAGLKLNAGKMKKGHWAAGGLFYTDRAGDGGLKTTQGNLGITYHVKLDKYQKLGLALQGGFMQRSVSISNLQWASQYVNGSYSAANASGEMLQENTIGLFDLTSGIVYTFNNTADLIKVTSNNFRQGTLGLAMHHLNRPMYGFMGTGDRLHIRYVLHGDFLYSLKNTPLAVHPGFMIHRQATNTEYLFGSMIRYELLANSKYTGNYRGAGISAGTYYRWNDAIIFSAMVEFSNYSIGFSYDLTTSSLRAANAGRGGMEICLRYVSQNPYFRQTRIFK